MKINRLRINNFRNYKELEINFDNKTVYLTGENGQGKTSMIEAISVLSLLNSFRSKNYNHLKNSESKTFFLEAFFTDSTGKILDVSISFDGKNKQISFLGKKISKMSDFYGKIPLVYLVPDQGIITYGPPMERRKYIDSFISMIDSEYFKALKYYNLTLKQKNSVLIENRKNGGDIDAVISVYNNQLIDYGTKIFSKRVYFINNFKKIFNKIITYISENIKTADIVYKSSIDIKNYREDFKSSLNKNRYLEIARGGSLIGPHKDDIVFKINDFNLRIYGSKGQHKIFLVALKLTELEYIKSLKYEYPIFLIDDLYSEIDDSKSKRIASLLDKDIQTFITTCDKSKLELFNKDSTQVIDIKNGAVYSNEA
ncbi:MAG: hypothetical protein CR982_02890 [Candidatus Cloacimonadota bacterium]|nr:MAG: hypothetical protein CR982_02890 [Candidatus Cloacimonadota bacterium]PIE79215.1 MAG: hypothetical protein CSA15_04085 [Candidatus Delongbacteria bacterium]